MRKLNQGRAREEIELARFIQRARAENPRAWARVEALRTACFVEASTASLEKHARLFQLASFEVDARSPGPDSAQAPKAGH